MCADYATGPENGARDSSLWADAEPARPLGVLASEAERERTAGAGAPSTSAADASAPVPTAPAPRWPSLLQILLARLRGEQPFENCFLCLTSDDPRDCCAVHHDRLEAITHYGEAA